MRIEGSRIVNELFDFLVSVGVVFVTVFVVIVVLEVVLPPKITCFGVVVVVVDAVVDDVVDVVTVDVVASEVVSIEVLRSVFTKVLIEFVIPSSESDVKLTALVFAASRISFSSKSLSDSASNIAMAFWLCLFRLSNPDRDCVCDSVSFARSKRVTLIS